MPLMAAAGRDPTMMLNVIQHSVATIFQTQPDRRFRASISIEINWQTEAAQSTP